MSYTTTPKPSLIQKGASIVLGALFLLALWRTVAAFGDNGIAFGVNMMLWGSIVIGLPLALLGVRSAYLVTLFSIAMICISSLGTGAMAIMGSLPVPPGMNGDISGRYYVITVIEALVVCWVCAGAILALRHRARKRKKN